MDSTVKWSVIVIGIVTFVCALLVFSLGKIFSNKDNADNANTVTPVECNCNCPEPKCPNSSGIVADGYNVTVMVNGEKYGLNPKNYPEDMLPVSMYCRVEDSETLERMGPDMTLTKAWMWLEECRDALDDIMAGNGALDDLLMQECRQGDASWATP